MMDEIGAEILKKGKETLVEWQRRTLTRRVTEYWRGHVLGQYTNTKGKGRTTDVKI